MNRVFTCAAVAAALISFGAPNTEAATNNEAQHFLGHTYQRFDGAMSWDDAKTYCESLGGHLATIGSTTEQAFIRNLVAEGDRHVYWLGGERTNGWNWVTDSTFGYTNWSEDRPTHQEVQDAKMVMYRVSPAGEDVRPGDWDGLPSTGDANNLFYGPGHIGFVCEWDK